MKLNFPMFTIEAEIYNILTHIDVELIICMLPLKFYYMIFTLNDIASIIYSKTLPEKSKKLIINLDIIIIRVSLVNNIYLFKKKAREYTYICININDNRYF